MGMRKLMDFIFSPIEMYWLDHMLPGEERIKREDLQVKNIFNVALCTVFLPYVYGGPGRVFTHANELGTRMVKLETLCRSDGDEPGIRANQARSYRLRPGCTNDGQILVQQNRVHL